MPAGQAGVVDVAADQQVVVTATFQLVLSVTADEDVLAAAACQVVVARSADQHVVTTTALDMVVAGSAEYELRNGQVTAAVVVVVVATQDRHDAVDVGGLEGLLDVVSTAVRTTVAAAALVQLDVDFQLVLLLVDLDPDVVAAIGPDDVQRPVD